MTTDDAVDAIDWALVLAGDDAAFARIFDRHSDVVYRFVRRRSRDTFLAEEITESTFVEAWRQRERIVLQSNSLRPWLFGVARNQLNRHWRNLGRQDRAFERLRDSLEPIAGDRTAEQLEAKERLEEVSRVLASMPASQRDVLLLSAWEQLSYEEISIVMSIPIGTVRSRIARARRLLREIDGTKSGDRASPLRSSNGSNTNQPEQTREGNLE